MHLHLVCVYSILFVFISNTASFTEAVAANTDKLFKVTTTWPQDANNITCGFTKSRSYEPFQCKSIPCTDKVCSFSCPNQRRSYTRIKRYIDGMKGAKLQNMAKPVPSSPGKGFNFTATKSVVVNIGEVNLLDFTFCTWMYIRKKGAQKRVLLDIYSSWAPYNYLNSQITLSSKTDDSIAISAAGTGFSFSREWTVPKETWTHVTVQITESEFSVFRNGTLVKPAQGLDEGLSSKLPKLSGIMATLGNNKNAGASIDGLLQDVRIYKSVLTNREIFAISLGNDIEAAGVDVLPYCFCPADYPGIPLPYDGSPYCSRNLGDSKVLRLGDEVHPIQYALDGSPETYWLSEPGLSNLTITALLPHSFEIFKINLIFHSLYPEYLYIIGDDRRYWHMFAKTCSSQDIPCQTFPSTSRLVWESNWDIFNRTNFYVTTEIRFRFQGFQSTQKKLQYYGLGEIEVFAGCSCNGRAQECDMTVKPPKCIGCKNSYGDMCQFCNDGLFLSPKRKGDLSCQSCRCNYTGVLNNILLCIEDGGNCVCNATSTNRTCDICNKDTGQCRCKKYVTGIRCDRCKTGYFNLTSSNPDGCHPCDCAIDGQNKTCDFITGECSCLPRVIGSNCSSCEVGFYARGIAEYKNQGCPNRCECNVTGTVPGTTCDMFSGQCQCKQNVTGLNCDTCSTKNAYLHNVSNMIGCKACGCDVRGTNENHTNDCNMITGQCTCKPHVESLSCDVCRNGYWNLDIEDPYGCKECKCYEFGTGSGTFCDKRTGQCKCLYHPRSDLAGRQCNPFLISFYPESGPRSGGTTLHISGGYFSSNDLEKISVGNNTCRLVEMNTTDIFCTTPSLHPVVFKGEPRVSLSVVFSGLGEIKFRDFYVYRKDPVIYSVFPLATIPSGGTELVITGEHFHFVFQAYMKATLYRSEKLIDIHKTKCDVSNSSLMTCETPALNIPKNIGSIVKRQDLHNMSASTKAFEDLRVALQFIFDGVVAPQDLNESLSIYQNLQLYPDPVFENFTEANRVKIFRQYKEESIKIKGTFAPLGTGQYRINIGVESCKITSLDEHQIICSPPETQPANSLFNVFNLPDVRASVGKKSPARHIGYLEYYVTLWDEPSTKYAVISTCVIVTIIIAILLLFIYLRRRRRRDFDKHIRGYVDPVDNPTINILDLIEQDLRDNIMSCLLDADDLVLLEVIGKGHFGQVRKGIYKDKNTHEPKDVAVKTVKDIKTNVEEAVAFLKEATIMKEFDHPNVLGLIGVVLRENTPLVVLPFMDYGDLKSFISDSNRVLKLCTLLKFGQQIAAGMTYLSSKRFVHRDLAARNCMLNKQMVLKIADFGLSRDIYQSDYYRMQADTGKALPIRWMAVESIIDGHFSTQSDVWSFGVILWELITRGSVPYPDVANHELRDYISNGHRMAKPTHAPEPVFQLMLQCWDANPQLRPSFEKIVNDIIEIIRSLGNVLVSDYDDGDCDGPLDYAAQKPMEG